MLRYVDNITSSKFVAALLFYCKINRNQMVLVLESINQLNVLKEEFHVKANLRLYVFFNRLKNN